MPPHAFAIQVPGYLVRLVQEVEEKTGYPVALTEEPGLGYDSITRFATADRPYHEISFVPEYRGFALHFLTVGMRKALRFWDVPEDERYVPASRADATLPEDLHAELLDKIPAQRGLDVDMLTRFLYSGTVRQLISVPGDVRVEREVAELVPDHRDDQRAYLERQVRDLEPHFSAEIEAFAPARLYAATTGMNVVLAEELADIAGLEPPTYVAESSHRALGHTLRARLNAEEEPGYAGDRNVTDAWAKELGLEGWFEWVRINDTC